MRLHDRVRANTGAVGAAGAVGRSNTIAILAVIFESRRNGSVDESHAKADVESVTTLIAGEKGGRGGGVRWWGGNEDRSGAVGKAGRRIATLGEALSEGATTRGVSAYLLAFDVCMGVHEPSLPRHHHSPSLSIHQLVLRVPSSLSEVLRVRRICHAASILPGLPLLPASLSVALPLS